MERLKDKDEFIIYTSEDLRAIFKVSKTTMNKWLKAGILPVVKIGREYRTSKTLMDNWFKQNVGKNILTP